MPAVDRDSDANRQTPYDRASGSDATGYVIGMAHVGAAEPLRHPGTIWLDTGASVQTKLEASIDEAIIRSAVGGV